MTFDFFMGYFVAGKEPGDSRSQLLDLRPQNPPSRVGTSACLSPVRAGGPSGKAACGRRAPALSASPRAALLRGPQAKKARLSTASPYQLASHKASPLAGPSCVAPPSLAARPGAALARLARSCLAGQAWRLPNWTPPQLPPACRLEAGATSASPTPLAGWKPALHADSPRPSLAKKSWLLKETTQTLAKSSKVWYTGGKSRDWHDSLTTEYSIARR